MFTVRNRNTRLTRHQNSVIDVVLVFLLLTWNIIHTFFYRWHWKRNVYWKDNEYLDNIKQLAKISKYCCDLFRYQRFISLPILNLRSSHLEVLWKTSILKVSNSIFNGSIKTWPVFFNHSRINPGEREKTELKFLFSHIFVVPQNVLTKAIVKIKIEVNFHLNINFLDA